MASLRWFPPCVVLAAILSHASALPAATAQPTTVSNAQFTLSVSSAGITSLKHTGDAFDTDYVAAGKAIGGLVITYKVNDDGPWRTIHTDALEPVSSNTGGSFRTTCRDRDLRIISTFTVEPDGPTAGVVWSIKLQNLGTFPIIIGDLAVTSPFNTQFSMSNVDGGSFEAHRRVLEQRELTHFWVAGHGSFVFLERANAVGPYLVMMPTGETKFEFFDVDSDRGSRSSTKPAATTQAERRPPGRLFFIHSAASGERLASQLADYERKNNTTAQAPTWRQAHTSITLAPAGETADHSDYTLKFRFSDKPASPAATNYDGVRHVLYDEGGYDINLAPGMTVPTDLTATIAIRTKNHIDALTPEFPDRTTVKEIPPPPTAPAGEHLFCVHFATLGENLLTIKSGPRSTVLEFFVTEPIETLIHKRAAFLVSPACRWVDSGKWYEGLITEWDTLHEKKRSPDDLDGLRKYIVSCDDPGLGKAPFVASKNAIDPNQDEVAALDYYIHHFVWGGLQMTTTEPHPYAIYGIETWFENRNSADPGRNGRNHIWRIYDYPHVVLLYYRMYQIAHAFPQIKTELSADEYLSRALGTAVAYFTVPVAVEGWSAYDTGTYNECIIADLIDALNAAGRHEQAEALRSHWEQKVKTFVHATDPYLFGSEYAFDSTTFESSGALAKWASERMVAPGYQPPPAVPAISIRGAPAQPVDSYPAVTKAATDAFLERQIQANIADRGWLETAYYYYGSDYRGGMGGGYVLSYMSQMGGAGVLDYALNHATNPSSYLRLGYGSQLSSWALMNTGTAESNYGYWFPGKPNDGSAGGGFEPGAFRPAWIGKVTPRGSWYYASEIDLGFCGALRTASTIVTDDPLLGRIVYGGEMHATTDGVDVLPRDGVRKRLDVLLGATRLHVELTNDVFAADEPIHVSADGRAIRFTVQNKVGDAHQTSLIVGGADGIPSVEGSSAATNGPDGRARITLNIGDQPRATFTLKVATPRR